MIERRKLGETVYLEYLLLDRVNEWLDSWKGIKAQIESRFSKHLGKQRQDWPVSVSGFFSAVDIKNMASVANLGTIFDQDIFVLSYLVSEIFINFENFRSFTREIADRAPRGARFLFLDRKGNRWKNEIRELARGAGIKLSAFKDTQDHMDITTEEASDLGSLRKEIGKGPKLTWNAFWVVGTKS